MVSPTGGRARPVWPTSIRFGLIGIRLHPGLFWGTSWVYTQKASLTSVDLFPLEALPWTLSGATHTTGTSTTSRRWMGGTTSLSIATTRLAIDLAPLTPTTSPSIATTRLAVGAQCNAYSALGNGDAVGCKKVCGNVGASSLEGGTVPRTRHCTPT